MARGYSVHGYTGFNCWITWECGACGEQGDIQTDSDDGEVLADIEHFCEVDDDN